MAMDSATCSMEATLSNIFKGSQICNFHEQFMAVSSTFEKNSQKLLGSLFKFVTDYFLNILSKEGYSTSENDQDEVRNCSLEAFTVPREPNTENCLNSGIFSFFCFTAYRKTSHAILTYPSLKNELFETVTK